METTASLLANLKQKLLLESKPFPLASLLYMYEVSNHKDTYCNYFEGFKLLVDWLGPIEIPEIPAQLESKPIPKLYHTYDIQEIAVILKTSQERIYHGYQTTQSLLQQSPHIAFMPTKVSTIPNECESK